MKNFKYFAPILLKSKNALFIILIFTGYSCSQYQYISINSNLNHNEEKEFINENDTVLIKYTFADENIPLIITIYNKLQQPIYIRHYISYCIMHT